MTGYRIHALIAVAAALATASLVSMAGAQPTTQASQTSGPISPEAMFGKVGETPGFYAFPDCQGPGLVIDGLKSETGDGYDFWLHQRQGGGPWVGLFTVGTKADIKPDGTFEFKALDEFVRGKAVDVANGVPAKIAEGEVKMAPMPAPKRLQQRGKDIDLVRCPGSAESVLGKTWRKLGF
ncbi:MAG TPA: hypothetical protein VG942_00550 [Hyphomonadaceae bacterium]|nr:hypothetical protein [Hyphomonadaceae bacterium]